MRWLPPLVVTFARRSPTMRGPICLSLILVITSIHMAPAQDAAGLRTAIEKHYSAIHAGDSEEVWSHHLSDFSLFPGRITSYNVCYTKLLRQITVKDMRHTVVSFRRCVVVS